MLVSLFNSTSDASADVTGSFFLDNNDAVKYWNQYQGTKVSATSLDDVFYTLIQKKTKLGKFITEGVSANADKTATYVLQPSTKEFGLASENWKNTHSTNDVPLFRIPNLVFNKEEGIEFPLFLSKGDALNSYDRLEEDKKSEKAPEIQETSLLGYYYHIYT